MSQVKGVAIVAPSDFVCRVFGLFGFFGFEFCCKFRFKDQRFLHFNLASSTSRCGVPLFRSATLAKSSLLYTNNWNCISLSDFLQWQKVDICIRKFYIRDIKMNTLCKVRSCEGKSLSIEKLLLERVRIEWLVARILLHHGFSLGRVQVCRGFVACFV